MTTFVKKSLQLVGITLSLVLLLHCGAPDTYQGNGIWRKSDGSTYQAPAPLNVSRARNFGGTYVREQIRTVEDRTVNSQGQTVIRQKDITTIQMDFQIMVTLENGEQHEMSFSVSGNRNSSQYTSASFTGSNGYSYRASGNVYLSQFNPTFNLSISSKGTGGWRSTIPLR